MHLKDFNYELPAELVAQEPAAERDGSRLLVVDRKAGTVSDRGFRDFSGYLKEEDIVVVNDTRVIPARLEAKKPTGGHVELLLVRKASSPEGERWFCLADAGKRIKEGTTLSFDGGEQCTFLGRNEEGLCMVEFVSSEELKCILDKYGSAPLPPYIKRAVGESPEDRERYQTIFAANDGSCAAPTAGLHFSKGMIDEVGRKTAGIVRITLHVGPGTFLPIRSENIGEHRMHAERFEITPGAAAGINAARKKGGRVVAVGTTVARTLEYAADGEGFIVPASGMNSLFIVPGCRFRAVDVLLTNFHLPKSTLLLLVCAFAGKELMMDAYRHAVSGRYRFYSYGDAMLIM